MILFLKKYFLLIIAIFILIGLSIDSFLEKKGIDDYGEKWYYSVQKACNEGTYHHLEECPDFILEYKRDDAITTFYILLLLDGFYGIFKAANFIPLVMFILVTYWFHQKLNSGSFKNELTRMKYNDFLKKNYKRVLKLALISPLFLIFLFLIGLPISSGFRINIVQEFTGNYLSTINSALHSNTLMYFIPLIINVYIFSVFFGNVAIFCCKKCKNFIVSIVCSYLVFLAIAFFFEIIVGATVYQLTGIPVSNYISLLNIFANNGVENMFFVMAFAIFLAVSSTYINYLSYKNKEDVIIECEK